MAAAVAAEVVAGSSWEMEAEEAEKEGQVAAGHG